MKKILSVLLVLSLICGVMPSINMKHARAEVSYMNEKTVKIKIKKKTVYINYQEIADPLFIGVNGMESERIVIIPNLNESHYGIRSLKESLTSKNDCIKISDKDKWGRQLESNQLRLIANRPGIGILNYKASLLVNKKKKNVNINIKCYVLNHMMNKNDIKFASKVKTIKKSKKKRIHKFYFNLVIPNQEWVLGPDTLLASYNLYGKVNFYDKKHHKIKTLNGCIFDILENDLRVTEVKKKGRWKFQKCEDIRSGELRKEQKKALKKVMKKLNKVKYVSIDNDSLYCKDKKGTKMSIEQMVLNNSKKNLRNGYIWQLFDYDMSSFGVG